MYLSRLRIFGFKSFAQKVEVHFPPDGITAVVGPNGCGKSNITEAIRWVLGETRAKQLRSSRMEDVIFSGTADRPQMNFAEVSLVINNDRGVLPSEYTEIQITRRVSRDGASSYFLNGQECRLKDIQNLFMDTGMGAASYSLMHEGMIREILSDDPQVRRQLFEETAGITKYKQQRKETLRQLEKTAVDLLRVEDHLRVVRQSLAGYERQVRKAEEWKRVHERLRDLELSLSSDQYDEMSAALAQLEQDRQTAEHQNAHATARLSTLEANLEERKLMILEEEQAYREAEQIFATRQLELKDIAGELRTLRERKSAKEQTVQKLTEDIDRAQERVEALQNEQAQLKLQLTEAESGDSHDLELERLLEARNSSREAYHEAREAQRQSESKRLKDMQAVNSLRSQTQSVMQKLDHLEHLAESTTRELEDLSYDLAEATAEANRTELVVKQFENELQLLAQQKEQLQLSKNETELALQGLRAELRGVEAQEMQRRTRLNVLEQMEKSGEGLDQGAQYLLQKQSDVILGSLSQKLELPELHSLALSFGLGELANSLHVQDDVTARQLGLLLTQDKKGKAYLVLDRFEFPQIERPNAAQSPGVLAWAPELIHGDPQWSAFAKWKLANYILVDSLDTAQELALTHQGQDLWFVAPDASARHACGLWRLGAASGENAWAIRKSEIQKLASDLVALEAEHSQKAERVQTAEIELEQIQTQLNEILDAEKIARDQLIEPARNLAKFRAQEQMLSKRLEQVQTQNQESAEQLAPLRENLASLEEELQATQNELLELENQCEQLLEQSRVSESRKNQAEEAYSQASQDVFAQRNAVDRIQQQIGFGERQIADLLDNANRWREDVADAQAELSHTESQEEELDRILEIGSERLLGDEARRDEAKDLFEEKNNLLEDLRIEIRDLNSESRRLTDVLHKGELRLEKLRSDKASLRERVFERYEVDLDISQVQKIEYDPDAAAVEIRELMVAKEKLGPVNLAAFEDYAEEKKRVEEVEKQFDDLDRARLSLQRTITRLDEVARERFLATFQQIRQNFQDVFASLMIDGETKLELDGDDPLEALISINARPTGKKMRGVQLLSGGERALTATALLFAMYMVKPSPYCILDEVDGPLDDANIGRFVQLLRRFSRQTQFIVVTHNKRTMAASDRLYGVTQEIKGISRIASVQLEEAASLVAP